ncbi:hypothetical protein BgAZ_203150 [Babesia gibsoni]|uniref:Uncharacterized protein n=1 Tax=Babesia gibsoni TaxID=33632 RepID=A0AAD8LM89_BABGI|nr:hypothetical protein BgAZ_203150 [Babesia gibsoni]
MLTNPQRLIRGVLKFYWWFNGIKEGEVKNHNNTMPILQIEFITDLVQSMLFPTVVDMCHFVIFRDRVFVSSTASFQYCEQLSWITAIHHLGAACGGILAWGVSYWKLERYLHKVPKFASLFLFFHMIYFLRVLRLNSMWCHIIWHGVYYVVYSFSQIAACNVMVTSVGKKQTGMYLTISSAVAKLGNISGPATLIMVSMLSPTSIQQFKSSFRMNNADIAYLFVLLLCMVRAWHALQLENPYEKETRWSRKDQTAPVLPSTNENNTNVAVTPSIDKLDALESQSEIVNERYRILPYVIFSVNILSLIGAGLSIRFMFMYLLVKFNLQYRIMWFANMCVPIASTVGLFVIDKEARKYGKLVTILTSKLIALALLYAFIKVQNPTVVLFVYVLRFAFQNTPMALKTTIMLKYSSESAKGYWLASDQISRVIMFGSTILGGHLAKNAGLEYCFKSTMVFYAASQLLLLPCVFLFPDV